MRKFGMVLAVVGLLALLAGTLAIAFPEILIYFITFPEGATAFK